MRYLSRTDTLAVLHTVCPHKDKDKMNMSRSQSANALKLALADFIITSKGNETISKAADHWLTELFSVNVFPQLAKVLSQRTARKPDDLECLMRGGHRKRFVLGPCLTDNPDEPIIASTSEHDSETTPDAPAAAQSSVTTITALEDDISPDRRRLYDLLAGLNDARIPSVIAFTERVIRANDWHGPRDEDDSTASWSLTEEEVETPRGVCSPVSPRSESISDTEAVELALPNERRTSVDDEVTVDELIELETVSIIISDSRLNNQRRA